MKGLEHLPDSIEVAVHDVTAELNDRAHDELDEASGELFAFGTSIISLELLGRWVEVVITPELLHEAIAVELELLGVLVGEAGKCEGPAEKCRAKGNGTFGRVNLLGFTHVFEFVGRDDDVGVLDDTLEVLVHGLAIDLEFENTAVDFVNHHNRLDLLRQGLSEDSLSLHTDTLDVVDDNEGTISDSEGGSNFRGEVDVAWRVDQVDQVRLLLAGRDYVRLVVE